MILERKKYISIEFRYSVAGFRLRSGMLAPAAAAAATDARRVKCGWQGRPFSRMENVLYDERTINHDFKYTFYTSSTVSWHTAYVKDYRTLFRLPSRKVR